MRNCRKCWEPKWNFQMYKIWHYAWGDAIPEITQICKDCVRRIGEDQIENELKKLTPSPLGE